MPARSTGSVKKRFLLRVDPQVYDLLEQWAADELRSVNGQIEFLLADALRRSGRHPRSRRPPTAPPDRDEDEDEDSEP
jgi:hypothetical protein